MTGKHEQTPEHQKAHDLADEAIDAAIGGDREKARNLAEQAKDLDPKIADEVGGEVEADRQQAESFQKGRKTER